MTTLYDWPTSWYRFSSVKFRLRAASQRSISPWSGRANVYGPHAQLWVAELTIAQGEKEFWQPMEAFIAQLGGMAGLMRIGDLYRRKPLFSKEASGAAQTWSDGTYFDDGSGWTSEPLPPTVHVTTAAAMGATSVIIGDLPASTSRVLRRNDLVEFRANGAADETPRLHVVTKDAPTDANGETRIEFQPPLRAGVAAGDMGVLNDAKGTFYLADEDQAIFDRGPAAIVAPTTMKLIEAIV